HSFGVFFFSGIQGFSAFRNWCHFRSGRKGVTGDPAKSCFSYLLYSFREICWSKMRWSPYILI
ncbi:unnamed protein product, partial [Bubo scandiacus]